MAQPTITGVVPGVNARAAAASGSVSVSFSQPLLGGSAGALQVFSSQRGGRRTGGATPAVVSGSTLTFTPSAYDFRPGETVFSTVTTAAGSSSGSLVQPWVGQFTVATGGTGVGNFGPHPLNPNPATGGDQPVLVAMGDVDGDGDLDVLTANIISSTVEVGLNDGTGSYTHGATLFIPAFFLNRLILGDLDGDGDLDLATSNGSAGTASIRLNNGVGSFSGGAEVAMGSQPADVALGDVDGDGDLDLLAPNASGTTVDIRLNDGSGSFSGSGSVGVVGSPQHLALGDADGDGDLDLLVANSSDVCIRFNNGSGTFGGGSTVIIPAITTNLVVGDVDGDGDLDFVVPDHGNSIVRVCLNNGAGAFSIASSAAVGTYPAGTALGDVDHDGDLDLVVAASGDDAVNVRLNNGSGVFGGGSDMAVVGFPYGVALGDVDDDGDLDFVTANINTDDVGVRLNELPPTLLTFVPNAAVAGTTVVVTGTNLKHLSSFTVNGANALSSISGLTPTGFSFVVPAGCTPSGTSTVVNPFGSAAYPSFVTLLQLTSSAPAARVNTAARASSAVSLTFTEPVTSGSAASVQVFSAQVGGRKAGNVTTSGSTASYVSTLVAPRRDFRPGETVSVSVPATVASVGGIALSKRVVQFTTAVGGTGAGNFVPHPVNPNPPASTYPAGVATGDVDHDGDLDLLITSYTASTVTVRLNDGTGNFAGGSSVGVSSGPNAVTLGDVDGDGDLDLLTANENTATVSVRLNNGAGVFGGGSDPATAYGGQDVVLGDIDGDGDLDLLLANTGTNTISVRLNNGAGTFAGGSDPDLGGLTYAVALGDVDSDGDLDLLASNYSNGTASVCLNDGSGNFAGGSSISVGASPVDIAVGDVDGDGDLDVLTASYSFLTPTLSLRLNDGTGTFSVPGAGAEIHVGSNSRSITLADVDHDGDLDLLASIRGGNTVSVRLNDGTGLFAPPAVNPDPVVGIFPMQLATGDFDADGDLDFVVGNAYFSSNAVAVFLNAGAPTITSFLPARAAAGTTVVVTGFDLSGLTAWTANGIDASASVTGITATGFSFVVPPGCTPSGTSTATTGFGSGSSTGFTALLKVVGSSPGANAPAAPASLVALNLTFTEPLNSGAAGNLKVFASQVGGLKPGAVSVSGSTASYASTLPGLRAIFWPGEAVQVTVPPTVTSAGGSIGAEPFVYQFITAAGGTGIGNFQPPSINANPSVGGAALDVTLGDVDGDGDLDLAAVLPASNAVRLRLNNGAGSFTGGGPLIGVGNGPTAVVLADVDGDGDNDLLTTNGSAHTVSVRLNSGAGSYGGGSDFAVGNAPQHLRLGDVDGDGDLDVLTANSTAHTVSVRLNNGSGSFAGGADVPVAFNPFDVQLADFDGDGDLDFVVSNFGTNTASVRFNNGSGAFSGSVNYPGNGPLGLAVGDFDRDGDADYAQVNSLSNSIFVYSNTASGLSFSAASVAVGSSPLAVQAADVDHDGDLDLLVTNTGSAGVSVLLNNGVGAFTAPAYNPTPAVGGLGTGLAVGDVDGDGDLDFVSADNSSGTGAVSVRFNQPPPPPTIISFTPPAAPAGTTVAVTGTTLSTLAGWTVNGINASASVTGITATGFNFVVPAGCTPSGTSTATTLWGSGSSGGFTALLQVASTSPAANAVAAPLISSAVGVTFTEPVTPISAFRLKVFSSQVGGQKNGSVSTSGSTANYLSTLPAPRTNFHPGERVSVTVPPHVLSYGGIAATGRVYQFNAAVNGPGIGDYQVPAINPSPAAGGTPYGVALGDVDGDGDLDMVVANAGVSSVSIRFNTGPGNFASGSDVGVGNTPRSITLADVDNDGDLDFLTANQAGNSVSIRYNDGAGNFAALTADPSVGSAPRGITTADVDGDGDLDLLTANSGSNTVSVRLNDGFGNFGGGADYGVGSQPANLTVGDVDGDGDLDILSINAGANTVSVRLNNGLGSFGGGADYGVGTQPRSVAVGDVDHDGDLDLLTANFGANTLSVRLNNGSGSFAGGADYSVGAAPFGLALGDVDSDGDLDALTSNFSGSTVSVRLNDGAGTFAPPATNANPGVLNSPSALALGDVDGDGDLDFVTTSALTGTNGIYVCVRLNQGSRPLLYTVTPAAELAGLPLTLFGADFTPGATVTIGGVAATVVFHTSSYLTVFVPPGVPAGPAAVVVTTATGGSPVSPPFAVLTVFDAFGSTCNTSVPYRATGDGQWHYLLATNGQVVAALHDTYPGLDTVAVQHRALGSAAPVRHDGRGHYYLDRDFHLTTSGGPFTGTTVDVRFFALTAEMARLQAADASVSYPTLKLTQYSGPREDCELTNDDFAAGDFRVLPAPASTPGGVNWLVADVSIADHFSEFYLTGSSGPLPVELLAFTAERQGTAVALNWRTALEKNCDRFELERSRDGASFEQIDRVAGQGSKASPTAYSFLDSQYPGETNVLYYRLRQVDDDGSVSYSPVRTVTVGGKKTSLTLYPNPARTAVAVTGLSVGASVEIFDALGRAVAHATADTSGTAQLTLPAGLAAGVYVVRSAGRSQRLLVE